MTGLAVHVKDVEMVYRVDGQDVIALSAVDLQVDPGESDPVPGQELRIGDVVLRVVLPTPRCIVAGLQDEEAAVDRQLLTEPHLGIRNSTRRVLPLAALRRVSGSHQREQRRAQGEGDVRARARQDVLDHKNLGGPQVVPGLLARDAELVDEMPQQLGTQLPWRHVSGVARLPDESRRNSGWARARATRRRRSVSGSQAWKGEPECPSTSTRVSAGFVADVGRDRV